MSHDAAKRVYLARNLLKKKKALGSLYYFAKYILGYDKLEPVPHGEVCEFMQEYIWHDTLLLLPRGNYKSTLRSVAFPMWMHERDPRIRIMLTSADLMNTKGWLAEIRGHYEGNEIFKSTFGLRAPQRAKDKERQVWHATALRTSPSLIERRTGTPTFVASSLGSSLVGQHFDMTVPDDMMNEKTSRTREQVAQVMDFFRLLIPILDPIADSVRDAPGPRHATGTRWGHDDAYARMIAADKKRRADGLPEKWRKMIRKAIWKDQHGHTQLFFPKVFTEPYLRAISQEEGMTKYLFSCQYLNDPQPDEDRVFRLHDMRFYSKLGRMLDPLEMMTAGAEQKKMPLPDFSSIHFKTVMATDPASTDSADSDWTSTVVLSVEKGNPRRFVRTVSRGQWKQSSKIVQSIVDAYLEYLPEFIGIESVGFMAFLKEGLEERFRKHGIHVLVTPLTHGNMQKPARIKGIEHFVQDGGMYFPLPDDVDVSQYLIKSQYAPHGWDYDRDALYPLCAEPIGALIDGLLKYPTAPVDDDTDALAYLVPHMRSGPPVTRSRNRTPKEGTFEWWRQRPNKVKPRYIFGIDP